MKTFDISKIDKSWTLFLDRDGVINKRLPDDYVKHVHELELLPGVLEAIRIFSQTFGRVVVVTNQQGIGKGFFSVEQLHDVHAHLLEKINEAGARIDAVYFAPNLASENSPMRKPGIGMALQAKSDFPEIDFSKSLILGDSVSDLQFGRAAGMFTGFVTSEKELEETDRNLADMETRSLYDFASLLV